MIENGNHTVVIESVEDLDRIMEQLKYVFDDLFKKSNFVRMRSRCDSCLDVTDETTFNISKNSIEIRFFAYSCNFPEDPETNGSVILDRPDVFSISYKKDDHFKCIAWKMSVPFLMEKDITPLYSPEDYEVHGEKMYADRNIRIGIRKNNDRTIISFQNFIDFKGLVPKYSHTIVFYHPE
ncbi:hypothetical protein [Bacillus safensis]|uniref:hypothetical protein n=1 Tax=Bacillus safensis TaxID=561879 RepID=UPI0021E5C9D3|nr:hypothetical protein [Bacillus safensis]UXO88850.1 hypothetical protein N7921_03865 [Bacillus safensis]